MTDHCNSRCYVAQLVRSSKKTRRLNRNDFSSHSAPLRTSNAYVHSDRRCIYTCTHQHRECVNTVSCWQRRMYATSLTQFASITDITAQHSMVEHKYQRRSHGNPFTHSIKNNYTDSADIRHQTNHKLNFKNVFIKNLSCGECNDCLLDVGGDVKLSTVVAIKNMTSRPIYTSTIRHNHFKRMLNKLTSTVKIQHKYVAHKNCYTSADCDL